MTLFDLIKSENGILFTTDLKMLSRKEELKAIQETGISVFFFAQPSGCNFTLLYQKIIAHWEDVKKTAKKQKGPFLAKISAHGKVEVISEKNDKEESEKTV